MSRSGYIDDDWEEYQLLNLYRGNVWRATVGKRGQALLREMAAALDAMPVRELVAGGDRAGRRSCMRPRRGRACSRPRRLAA
jgi:hypothetical protein